MNNDKYLRSEIANNHMINMQLRYKDKIDECIKQSIIYGPTPLNKQAKSLKTPRFIFENLTTQDAIYKYRNFSNIAILNFASYRHPGGGFLNGSIAQEEALCHSSILFNVLNEMEDFYKWNNENVNNLLYCNRAIYTPKVKFIINSVEIDVDVLTCAAPNLGAARKKSCSSFENTTMLYDRIKFIKEIIEQNKVTTFIAGAFGCGAFKQNPEEVANIFNTIFNKTSIDNIIMAVPGKNENSKTFEKSCEIFPSLLV